MNLSNFQEVFQIVENKDIFDNNYASQNTHGSYITNDQELLTPSFINNLNDSNQAYEMFDEQQQFQIAQIWRGDSNQQSQIIKDGYFQFTPTQTQWEKYFRLYIQSLKSLNNMKTEHTKYSLFHQQLSYSIPKNNCYLTIDTDVYIPKKDLNDTTVDHSQAFKEDDNLLIQFMETLRIILAKYVRIPMIDQLYQLDPSHKLFDYIITCRAKTDDVDNPEHKSKNENYVRYGYHTYFYNLVCGQETKNMLYNLIKNDLQQDKGEFSILNKLKERYQETFQLSEYLDRGPFVGTSSLPFTSGKLSSVYTYIIDPEDNVRITATSRPQRFKELFLHLNPFRGFGIPIKTRFQEKQNIILFIKNEYNHCHDYFTGIRFVNSHIMNNIIHKDIIKWFYSNIVLKVQHLYWNDHKDVFIQNTYTLLNQDLFLTELFYFIAMCEDPEGIIKSDDSRYDQSDDSGQNQNEDSSQNEDNNDNFCLNRERDRYPIKCHLEVQRVLKDRLNGINQSKIIQDDEEEKALRNLIEWFNNIMEQRCINSTNDERPYAPIITENPYSIYQKFSKFLQKAWNSCLASTPFEDLNIDYVKSQFDVYLYQTVFKNTRCISEQGKNIQTHDDTLYEYIPIEEDTKRKIHPYEPTPEQGHYQILKTSKFISIMSNSYDKLINDYALIVNSSARFNELQIAEDGKNSQQSEKPNSKISKQKKIIQSLTIYKVRLSENSCKQLIPALSKAHGFDQIAQPNNTRMILGVYNGILKYDHEKKNFYMLGNDECIKYFQTQTTLFKVPKQFINKDGFLISEQDFQESTLQDLEPYKKAYQKILQIFTDIFGESQLCVLKWKISSILFQILAKTPTQHILIEYGTGGDGKSMNNEAIQYILGLSSNNQQVLYEEESRKIQNIGYSTIAKSSVLITSEVSSAQHDSGGLSELEQSYFASFAELTSNQPLSSSAIKRLVGGTSITCRKAHSPNSTSFVNKAFIVLQTNNYPRFDQTLDDGTVRRMLFYQYPHKFLDSADYNKAKDKTNIRLKDFSLQNIFQENIYMVDMFGVFMLWTFLESQQNDKITSHNPIARPIIPQIVVQQSSQFFQNYDKECNAFLQKYLYIQTLQNTSLTTNTLNSTIESQESSTIEPQTPQLIHYMTYTSLRTLIDMYCNENQVKYNKSILMNNITFHINKKFMNQICVYQLIEKRGKMTYKRISFDINAFETYTRQQNYIIFYEGFQPKKGNQVGQQLTEDDKLHLIIEDQIDGNKKKQK